MIDEIVPRIDDEFKWAQVTLPWCFDQQLVEYDRRLGRGRQIPVNDFRLDEAEKHISFDNKAVLEVGACEGNISVDLIRRGARLTTFDARLPNVLKTLARISINKQWATVLQHNADKIEDLGFFQVIVHIGVFYHLADPINQLEQLSRMTDLVLLDTHTAIGDESHWWDESDTLWGGMQPKSYWLTKGDLQRGANRVGFAAECIWEDDNAAVGPRSLWLLRK